MKILPVFPVLALLVMSSCATKKEIIYFQDIEELDLQEISQNFEPIIEKNDILYISVSSMNEEVVKPFQRASTAAATATNLNPGLQGYLVGSDGTIQFPVLGAIDVAGKTRKDVQGSLKEQLSAFVTDVVVDVRIMNFKVTVLGEVNNPGVYTIDDERVTLPQALGLAGDLTEDGQRDRVVVIREENGKQRISRIDLTGSDLFSSPFFFLKQNDVVYVEPSLRGVKKSGFIPDIPALLSLATVVLSATILITRI